MPGGLQKFMAFLGLAEDEPSEYIDDRTRAGVDDSYYDDDDASIEGPPPVSVPASSIAPPPPPDPAPRIKTLGPDDAPAEGAVVRSLPRRADRLHVVEPAGFNDAKEIGDQLKRGVPVIVNLADVDRDLRRRLVDFASGLAYGINGKMERVAENVFLISPSDVEVSAEEKRRLAERGLFSTGV